jgi:predicted metalloprotease with PDZ domain
MKNKAWISGIGLAALVPVLIALPGHSAGVSQEVVLSGPLARQHVQRLPGIPGQQLDSVTVLTDDGGPSWLGVETREVDAERVKELKLPAERGVVVGRVAPNSPAAKAGLKENDVITEVGGQRVEGAAQFGRMIHETPAGRTIQLTVWREGQAQTLSATLGQAEEIRRGWMNTEPGAFALRMPEVEIPDIDMPEVAEMPDMPNMEFDNGVLLLPTGHPRLGIDAEDISGQLGTYFGAPEGEGILVRNVNPGSPAEKGGVKAGDVITTFNGERIRSLGDLREKLAGKKDEKPAKLGVLRNKSALSLSVELPAPQTKTLHRVSHSTNI